jgi:hypothetical protein
MGRWVILSLSSYSGGECGVIEQFTSEFLKRRLVFTSVLGNAAEKEGFGRHLGCQGEKLGRLVFTSFLGGGCSPPETRAQECGREIGCYMGIERGFP